MAGISAVASETPARIVFNPTPDVLAAFQQKKIFLGRDVHGSNDDPIVWPKSVTVEPYSNFPHRRVFDCGAFSYCETAETSPELTLGRYCSVAFGLCILGVRHPMEWVTQSSITYDFSAEEGYHAFVAAHRDFLDGDYKPKMPERHRLPAPIIHHDVWIGQNVQLARGITIGTGSVIAAGAVVTRDVMPYSVVAGVPARVIKMRFDEATIARLLRSEWWAYSPSILFRLDVTEPEAFLDAFEALEARGLAQRYEPTRVTWRSIADIVAPRLTLEVNKASDCSFLRSGWSCPEPEFTWCIGHRSVFELPATLLADKGAIEIELFPVPYKRQTIEVTLMSGDDILAFAPQAVSPYESMVFRFPDRWSASERPLVVQIDHPDGIKPVSIGFNDDEREISVALKRIVLKP